MAAVQVILLTLCALSLASNNREILGRKRRSSDLYAEHRALPAEHNALPYNILADIPAATDNSFVWRARDGSYRFGMRGTDQWRVETRDRHGSVQGQYFYRTPDGGKVNFRFSAGPKSRQPAQVNEQQISKLAARVRSDSDVASDAVTLSLHRLQEQEDVLPYGALKIAHNKDAPLLRAGDREDLGLHAVITEIKK